MSKSVAEMFGLTEITDGEYAYLNPTVDKDDYVRIVMEYEILMKKCSDLEKKYTALLNNTKMSFAKMKNDMDQLKAAVYQGGENFYV
ncbi:MAG: hypothetical protein IKF80_07735 [Erysipelotrichaceae bacterium]|nr:hypothetical protein [Erysipelotrichaceae bacterium]